MPTEARRKKENRNDIDGNACGICRARGLSICKCRGGGGGQAEDESSNNGNAPTPKCVPTNIEVKALSSYLENSEVWNSEDEFLYNFNNDLAIFSMVLDSARGLIYFKGDEFLSADNKKDLNALYDAIEHELKKLANEVNSQNIGISREGNNLRISNLDRKSYDLFVTRLLNKNLIPTNNYNADLDYQANQNTEQKVGEKETATAYKSPNPFDISNGPRPINE